MVPLNVDTKPLDRRPLQAVLILFVCAASYAYVLLAAINLQLALPAPAFMTSLIPSRPLRFWTWDQLTHLLAVLGVSLPFAWLLSWLFSRKLALVSALVVSPVVIWMALDYLMLSSELPVTFAAVSTFYVIGVVEIAVVLPLLTIVLGRRSGA